VYSDAASDDAIQRNIGADFSFDLGAEIGVRYHFSRNTGPEARFEYRHISNASTADRNPRAERSRRLDRSELVLLE